MREPEWVYVQRRRRAVAGVALGFGVLAMSVVVGGTLGGGFEVNLGPDKTVALDRPDVDEILARDKAKNAAVNERKTTRREARDEAELAAARRARARREARRDARKRDKQDRDGGATPQSPTPAAKPAPAAPAPAPASTPAPAPAPAPSPQPSPQPASGGGVDPRFY